MITHTEEYLLLQDKLKQLDSYSSKPPILYINKNSEKEEDDINDNKQNGI